jgi:ribonuclease HII
MTNSARSVQPGIDYEQRAWAQGYRTVFGLDEAGRGTWAGPVYAGAVCLPPDTPALLTMLKGVRDSKLMSRRQRESLVDTIQQVALAWGVGSASSAEIDSVGIVAACHLAMQRSLEQAETPADYLLIDGFKWGANPLPQTHIVKGDRFCLSIAAASVLAKVTRDSYMLELDAQFPEYGMAQHKGYGTPQHKAALLKHGVSHIHRTTFRPMREMLDQA